MKSKKGNFLLISPTLISEAPMTIAMLSAILKEEGFSVSTIVNTFRKPLSVKDFVQAAKDCKADLVGINMMTFEILFIYKIIKALKKEGFTVMVGGAHPTDCPEECIENGADIVIQGEGEDVLREICRSYPNIKKGILPRKPPVDLETLPAPNLDVFDLDLFRQEDGLIKGFHRIYTSRGCPGRCTFCDWQIFKQDIRFYPISHIVDDIKRRIENYGITNFTIADDCFTINHELVYEFCKEISKIRPRIVWQASSRANLVSLDLLKAMKQAGCYLICFGFESGDPDTLLRVKKFVTLEQNIKAAFMAAEAGLQVYGNLMTGFPWETPKHVENNIKFIRETWKPVSLFQVSGSLTPFPGTEIYQKYVAGYGFEKYWLNPKYQQTGIQIYQNVVNSLAVSTFYQRYFFDDTYIQEETFFKYSKEYKKKVRDMVLEIGRHNLLFMFKNQPLRQKLYINFAKLSMMAYDYFPNLEKRVGGKFYELFNKQNERSSIEQVRDKRRGILKNKQNIEI